MLWEGKDLSLPLDNLDKVKSMMLASTLNELTSNTSPSTLNDTLERFDLRTSTFPQCRSRCSKQYWHSADARAPATCLSILTASLMLANCWRKKQKSVPERRCQITRSTILKKKLEAWQLSPQSQIADKHSIVFIFPLFFFNMVCLFFGSGA